MACPPLVFLNEMNAWAARTLEAVGARAFVVAVAVVVVVVVVVVGGVVVAMPLRENSCDPDDLITVSTR